MNFKSSVHFPLPHQSFKTNLRIWPEGELIDKLYETTFNYYKQKGEINATLTFPVIKNVYERPGNSFEKIVVPFTDGNKTLNVVTQLEKAYQTKGKHLIEDFERNIT